MAILFFDVDGTIFDGNEIGVYPEVIDAIHKVQSLGHRCFIASGRPYGFIADNIKAIGFDGYVLCNGSQFRYQDKDIFKHTLDRDKTYELLCFLEKYGYEYVLTTNDSVYLRDEYQHLVDFYKMCGIYSDTFISYYQIEDVVDSIMKIEVYFENEEKREAIMPYLKNYLYVFQEGSKLIEITNKDHQKGMGVEEAYTSLGYDKKESYCFGDGLNDLEMFDVCGHPVAMDNAIQDVKDKAEYICGDVKDKGVIQALERYFDI